MSDIREVRQAARTDIGYECELCNTRHASYAGMMRCENDCYDEMVAARRNHTSPRVMQPMREWWDD